MSLFYLIMGLMSIGHFIHESSFSCGTHKYVGCSRLSVLHLNTNCLACFLVSEYLLQIFPLESALLIRP